MAEISEEVKINIGWFALIAIMALVWWFMLRKRASPPLTGTPANPYQPQVTTPVYSGANFLANPTVAPTNINNE